MPTSTCTPNSLLEWLLDIGATSHIMPDPRLVECVTPYQGFTQVTVGNGNTLSISSIGKLALPTHSIPPPKRYFNYASPYCKSLSTTKFVKENSCFTELHTFSYVVKDFPTRIPLLIGNIHNNLYLMKMPSTFQTYVAFVARHIPLNL